VRCNIKKVTGAHAAWAHQRGGICGGAGWCGDALELGRWSYGSGKLLRGWPLLLDLRMSKNDGRGELVMTATTKGKNRRGGA
jgi:hypothetical protein